MKLTISARHVRSILKLFEKTGLYNLFPLICALLKSQQCLYGRRDREVKGSGSRGRTAGRNVIPIRTRAMTLRLDPAKPRLMLD